MEANGQALVSQGTRITPESTNSKKKSRLVLLLIVYMAIGKLFLGRTSLSVSLSNLEL